ncbi:MAG: LysR family transcriptional regulator [Tumebacillaceae bacterium]
MDLRALKTFQMVVKAGSFQQAAQELQYVQSTVTMQIKKLEADLGVTLFQRGKKLTLTEAGRLLLEHSSPLLHNVEVVEQTMREVARGEAGVVRVGCIEPTASRRFSPLISEFCSARPNVSLIVESSSTRVLSNRVLIGDLDFAICSQPQTLGDAEFEPLFSEPIGVILPITHPLAAQEHIQWADLQKVRMLHASTNCQYRWKLDNALLQRSQTLPNTLEVAGSYELMMQLVEQGLGVAFAPTVYADIAPDKLVCRPICDVKIDLPVGLYYRRDNLPLGIASSAFVDHIRTHLKP